MIGAFKTYLQESTVDIDDVYDLKKWKLENIMEALANNGLNFKVSDFDIARDLWKYTGYNRTSKNHVFTIAFEDEGGDFFDVTHILVWLNERGKIVADFPGVPLETNLSLKKAVAMVAKDKIS
jgi:hypothetical protein